MVRDHTAVTDAARWAATCLAGVVPPTTTYV